MKCIFLILFLITFSVSLRAQNTEEISAKIISKYITLEGYNKWIDSGNYKYGYIPDVIKNKTNIAFHLAGQYVGAVTYYPYIEYVCAEAAKFPDSKRQLLLEASAWIQSDMSDTIKTDRTGLVLTADLVFAFLLPELDRPFQGSVLSAPITKRVELAMKVQRICSNMAKD